MNNALCKTVEGYTCVRQPKCRQLLSGMYPLALQYWTLLQEKNMPRPCHLYWKYNVTFFVVARRPFPSICYSVYVGIIIQHAFLPLLQCHFPFQIMQGTVSKFSQIGYMSM